MIHGLKALAAAMLLALAGCVATGHDFNSISLGDMTPGQTTMAQAVYLLAAPPDQIFPQSDGTTIAVWRVHVTMLTDSVYATQEARLLFGPDGRLMRLIDTTNIPLSTQTRQKLLGVAPPPAPPAPPAAAPGAMSTGAPAPAPATMAMPASTGTSTNTNLGNGVAGAPPGMDSLRTYSVPIPSAPAPVSAQ